MNTLRESISIEIQNRCNFLTRDTNTFLWAKSSVSKQFDLDYDHCNIGGGNILIIHGLFAVINYLSKAYYILNEGDKLMDGDKKKFLKNYLKTTKLRYEEKDFKLNKCFQLKPEINETDAFIVLIMDSPINWCLDKDKLSKVWKSFRNKLAHLAIPNGPSIAAETKDSPFCTRKEKISRSTGKVFIQLSDGNYACNADLLQRDTEKLINWLSQEILNREKYDDSQVERLNSWMNGE